MGWGSARIIVLLAAGVVGTAAFLATEERAPSPTVALDLFRSRNFVSANTVAFVISFAMMGSFFFLAIYMQNLLGYSPIETGVRSCRPRCWSWWRRRWPGASPTGSARSCQCAGGWR